MISLFFVFAFSFSIYIAGFIGFIRFKKIHKNFYPFLLCIWIACLNELLTFILFKSNHNSSINSNFYVLLESLLITLLFKNLGVLKNPRYLYYTISLSLIIIWLSEIIILRKINVDLIYFRIFYSFVVVLMSISCINILIGKSGKFIIKNSVFLLCLGFILYFTYKVLIHSFWLYGLTSSKISF